MKKASEKLSVYHSKRSFAKTPEPHGDNKLKIKHPIFVIQKHDARNLHYDFRIEVGGVLVSWALPKGPPLEIGEKHLAIQTEDHPIEYAQFEGVIPEGQYGAGPVIVWDLGTYENSKTSSISKNIKDGEITIILDGEKLEGPFALIRTSYNNNPRSWIMIRMKDNKEKISPDLLKKAPESVLSGYTIEEIERLTKKGAL